MNQPEIALSLHAVPKLDVARDVSLGVGLFELLLVLAASGFSCFWFWLLLVLALLFFQPYMNMSH
jgi:hypothetical protein